MEGGLLLARCYAFPHFELLLLVFNCRAASCCVTYCVFVCLFVCLFRLVFDVCVGRPVSSSVCLSLCPSLPQRRRFVHPFITYLPHSLS